MPSEHRSVRRGRLGAWVVVVLWAVLVGVAGPVAGRLGDVEQNDAAAYLPESAESLTVVRQQQEFPGADVAPAIVVYERPAGITVPDRERVARQAQRVGRLDFVRGPVVGPVPSKDGKALQLVVPVAASDDDDVVGEVDRLRSVVGSSDGLTGQVTGPAGLAADQLAAFGGIDSTLLFVTVGVVVLILLIVYRSPFLWLLPLTCAGLALLTAQAANYLLARYADLTVSGQSSGILTVLVLGAGTDYALLIIARYREELHRHDDRFQAMAVALRRAGPAVVASAATVILGLVCLLLAELNSTSGLGPVAAVGVASGLLAMTTLLPALLVILGRWVFWPFVPRVGVTSERPGMWDRIGAFVVRRSRRVWAGTAVALAVCCLGLVVFDGSGLRTEDSFASRPESVTGQQVLARHFDAGQGNPAVVIGRASSTRALAAAAADVPGVVPGRPQVHGRLVQIEAQLRAEPDSAAAFDTVERLRTAVHAVPGADAHVGGTSALTLDTRRANERDTRLIIPVVLAVVFIVLALLLRSLVAPLLLIGTVGLSFAAALGVSSVAFRYVLGFAGEDVSVLLYSFIFLVALGIDYNIFLTTRVREEALRDGIRPGVRRGVAATGGVITSAGVVLAATFTALTVLPLVVFIEVGVTVAVGVLLDTLVVRSILVPALLADLGRPLWWPGRLARSEQGSARGAAASAGAVVGKERA